MTSQLHLALEKLDRKIDQLETALEAFLQEKAAPKTAVAPEPAAAGDKAEALAKLDGIIGKLETILKA
jgi:phage shock protein A